jgi:hypothetical protein
VEDLDVLLRHRLLPQPGGFESFSGVEVGQNPSRLAVLEIEQVGDGRLGLGSACRATCMEVADREYLISQVADLNDLNVELGESLVEVSDEMADTSCPQYTVANATPPRGRAPAAARRCLAGCTPQPRA